MKYDKSIIVLKKEQLMKLSSFLILDHIFSCFEILIKSQNEFTGKNSQREESIGSSKEYEQMLQKLEKEVRDHIGIEQQLKLYIESFQTKIEENEAIINNFKESLKEKSDLIIELQQNLKQSISMYNELIKSIKNKDPLQLTRISINKSIEEKFVKSVSKIRKGSDLDRKSVV